MPASLVPRSHRRLRRRLTSALAVTALALTAAAAPVSGAAAADTVAAPAMLSSSAAATLPELVGTCSPRQTDINHAGHDALVAAFGIGGPVADRLIAARPFASVLDLLAVNGIGRSPATVDADHPADPYDSVGIYNRIVAAGSACVTPVTIATDTGRAPVNPDPCTTTAQTDIATATLQQLQSAFNLSATVSQRVISNRPYGNTGLLGTDRVPGVGAKSRTLIAAHGCLTPSPVRTDATSWRWAYPAYSTTVTRDQYALAVPAGVVDSPAGAWASITPTAPIDPVAFDIVDRAADFHVWGPWADGTDAVTVTVPSPSYLGLLPDTVEWVPMLKHKFSDGTGGENLFPMVNPDTGQLSARETSLSLTSGFYAIKDFAQGLLIGNRFSPPTCSPNWPQTDKSASNYQSPFQDTHVVLTDSQLNLPGNDLRAGLFLLHCVGGTNDHTGSAPAVTTIVNNSGAVSIDYDVSNDHTTFTNDSQVLVSDPSTFIHLLIDTSMALTNIAYTGKGHLVGPGDAIDVSTPAGTRGVTSISPNVPLTALNAGINALLGNFLTPFAGAISDEAAAQAFYKFAEGTQCVYSALQAAGESDAPTQVRAALRAGYSCFIEQKLLVEILSKMVGSVYADKGQTSFQGQAALKAARGTLVATKLAEFVGSVSDALVSSALQSNFVADHYLPNPTLDAEHRAVKEFCVLGVGSVHPTVDEQCQNAYYTQLSSGAVAGTDTTGSPLPLAHLVKTRTGTDSYLAREYPDSKTIAAIPTSGDYVCFTKFFPVDWYSTVSEYNQAGWAGPVPIQDAKCDDSTTAGYPVRNLTPDTINATGAHVLRKADGESFIYVGGGVIEPIPSQQEFVCWVSQQYATNLTTKVWDYVSDAELARFTLDTVDHSSNCGNPVNPTF